MCVRLVALGMVIKKKRVEHHYIEGSRCFSIVDMRPFIEQKSSLRPIL